MIIDFHTHVFPDKIAEKTIKKLEQLSGTNSYINGTVDGLIESMKDNNIDISVILPVVTRPEQFKKVNEFADIINKNGNQDVVSTGNIINKRLISFAGIHPETSDYKAELNTIESMGFKGIKLHPDYQMTMIDDIKYMRIVDFASELGLIITVHSGIDVGYPKSVHCTPQRASKLIKEVKPAKLVLAHMGGWQMWDEVKKYLLGENVYFDTAYVDNSLAYDDFKEIVENHGADKILFATDSPWSGQRELVKYVKEAGFDRNILDKIFYKNAKSLLDIS